MNGLARNILDNFRSKSSRERSAQLPSAGNESTVRVKILRITHGAFPRVAAHCSVRSQPHATSRPCHPRRPSEEHGRAVELDLVIRPVCRGRVSKVE